MADLKYYDIIVRPVITEKSMDAMSERKYTFLVQKTATKGQIKEAVEKLFQGTKVEKVNTMNSHAKKKRVGKFVGTKTAYKKAIVTLTADSKEIVLFEGMEA